MGQTFSEKIFSKKAGKEVQAGEIVFAEPDLVLSHDNTASIYKTFEKMGGKKVKYPERVVVVIDHDAPPTSSTIANDHDAIRTFVKDQGVTRFHDAGEGICHQMMSQHVLPGQLVVGSDSHTCTSGAFAAFAAGIDRTETAGLWLTGTTWFRVPETIKVNLHGKLPLGVFAKDIALFLMGHITSSGANYQAIEFHGDGVEHLSVSERMTLTNLASEMGAKNAVFPADHVLKAWVQERDKSTPPDSFWADEDATYVKVIDVNLEELVPLVAAPHEVDNVKPVSLVGDVPIQQAFLGTCTNARLDDLRVGAQFMQNKKVDRNVQFLVAPASREVLSEAMKDGTMATFVEVGGTVLSTSCGPCLGKGQGIPADGWTVVSTANRNFLGRMGNKKASIYLASPATVAASAVAGKIVDPRGQLVGAKVTPPSDELVARLHHETSESVNQVSDDRYSSGVWDYSDVDNFNTDAMFAGGLTYDIKSSDPEKIVPHLFKGLDERFAERFQAGDVIVAGDNFGCGSSREHPAVGLAHQGVKAVLVKSVNRIFYRASVNQGLPIIVHPEAVTAYKRGDSVEVDMDAGVIKVAERSFPFPKLPSELMTIFKAGGLIQHYQALHK